MSRYHVVVSFLHNGQIREVVAGQFKCFENASMSLRETVQKTGDAPRHSRPHNVYIKDAMTNNVVYIQYLQ